MERILVGTREGSVVVGDPGPPDLEGDVTALARGDGGLWALTGGARILQLEAGGWRETAASPDASLTCLLPVGGRVYLGAAEARLLRWGGSAPEPVESFDDAPTRETWYTPWGGPPDVRSLSADGAGTLYVNVHVGGILRSDDDGESWVPTIDVDADVHQVMAHPREARTVLAATARGLAVSRDAGASWTFHTEGLHAPYCRAVAVGDRGVLVSASVGPFGGRAAVYRFADGSFEQCTEGLPDWFGDNINTHCLSAGGRRAAFGTSEGHVYASDDGGHTWERVAESLPPTTAVLLD